LNAEKNHSQEKSLKGEKKRDPGANAQPLEKKEKKHSG